jgi:tRNA pseudouridine13 synthase
MYVHSWQSYIWNRLVSERIKLFGASAPVEGDLVYAEQVGDDEPVAADEDGHVVADEAPSVNANAATPAEAAAANPQLAHFIATSSVPKVHALTAQDIKSGKYTIQDVVLPMPGFAVQYPAGQLGEVYRRVIREDGINPDDMWRKQKEYSLVSRLLFSSTDLSLPPAWMPRADAATAWSRSFRAARTARSCTCRRTSRTGCWSRLRRTRTWRRLTRTTGAASARVPRGGRPAQGGRIARAADRAHARLFHLYVSTAPSLLCLRGLTSICADATMALREVLKSRTSAATQKSLTQAMEARLKTEAEPSEGAPANEGTQSEVAPAPQAPVE